MIGGPGSEACPVVHLVLQRGEERLGHGAAVAVAGTAARRHTVVWRAPTQRASCGVLGAPIAVENGVSGHAPVRQRRRRDVGGHAVGEQPLTTMRVHRSTTVTRKSQPSLVRRYVMSPTSL